MLNDIFDIKNVDVLLLKSITQYSFLDVFNPTGQTRQFINDRIISLCWSVETAGTEF